MPINPDILLNKDLEEVEGYWSEERIILYNIAVGSSQDPMNKSDLKFTVGPSPKVLPSFAACIYPMESVFSIIGSEGLEVSMTSLLHGEQKITIHKDIPSSGKASARSKITAVEDYIKFGSVTIKSDLYMDNDKIATSESVMLFIGEGGFGAKPKKKDRVTSPKTDPQKVLEYKTLDNQAILYRVPSGDNNPLHVDPDFAKVAGFEKPILHGLCTYGITCKKLIESEFSNDPSRVSEISARFSGPVTPGNTLSINVWNQDSYTIANVIEKETNSVVLKDFIVKSR
jgi:acyl dehydratase